jgi:two-component system invasion response regulator UvrY
MNAKEIKILIADDHALIRKALKSVLNSRDMEVSAEARDAQEVFDRLEHEKFDCLVLDISLPGKSGLDILPEIKQNYPEMPVLIFSIYPDEQFEPIALRAGASAYVNKACEPERLIKTVRRVVQETDQAETYV